MTYRSSSSEQTKEFAAALAAQILKNGPSRRATVLALHGELGAGKTTFVQGFFKGLGLKRAPASPTFIFMRRTRMPRRSLGEGGRRTGLKKKGFRNVFHVDAYRAKHPGDLEILNLPQIYKDPQNIVLIEWPERLRNLPRASRRINFRHGRHVGERVLSYRK